MQATRSQRRGVIATALIGVALILWGLITRTQTMVNNNSRALLAGEPLKAMREISFGHGSSVPIGSAWAACQSAWNQYGQSSSFLPARFNTECSGFGNTLSYGTAEIVAGVFFLVIAVAAMSSRKKGAKLASGAGFERDGN